MKITKFEIDGFKSLKNLTLRSFSNINMIYGYNNSGKSNILRALELIFKRKNSNGITRVTEGEAESFSQAEQGNFWEGTIENTPFIFNVTDGHKTNSFEFTVTFAVDKKEIKSILGTYYENFATIYFHGNQNQTIPIIIEGVMVELTNDSSEMFLNSVLINRKEFYSINDKSGEPTYLGYAFSRYPSALISSNRYYVFQRILGMFNDCILLLDNDRYFVSEREEKIIDTPLNSRNFKNWLYFMYLNPDLFKSFNELILFIKKFKVSIDPRNSQLLECEKNSPINKMQVGFARNQLEHIELMFEMGTKRLPLANFGTGIHQLLYLLTKIFSESSRIILIEELELNLSPKYQGEILKHLNRLVIEKKIDQIFFTTHTKYFQFRNDFSIYETNLNNEGNTSCTKVISPKKAFFDVTSLE